MSFPIIFCICFIFLFILYLAEREEKFLSMGKAVAFL